MNAFPLSFMPISMKMRRDKRLLKRSESSLLILGGKYSSAASSLLFRVCFWESVCLTQVALGLAEKIAIA